ncbi:hypothetical protein ACKVWM_005313 [Pyricularia oryzae]
MTKKSYSSATSAASTTNTQQPPPGRKNYYRKHLYTHAEMLTKTQKWHRVFCTNGSHWAPRGDFSKSQLQKWHGSFGDTKISCSKHTNLAAAELRCTGPCGRVLAVTCFSKNQRSAGGSQECLDCVAWGLSQEPGHTVLATVDVQQTQEEACRDLVSREAPKNRALQIDDGNQKALTFENMSSTASMTSETSFSTATSSRVSSNSQGPWARPAQRKTDWMVPTYLQEVRDGRGPARPPPLIPEEAYDSDGSVDYC